eukprot:TRINITY_DN3689_c0_g1_i3.p1 TRINITY_DN3689_c0_g1~~TRINITY_DN3689_c0_g1_i3.p1  ORF type:complete len:212 (-),score=40.74 TRINITY_DN3689_c0_g1_i3:185-820(-)
MAHCSPIYFLFMCTEAGHGILVRVPGRDYKLWHDELETCISWIHSIRQAREQANSPSKPEPTSEKELAKLLLDPAALENPERQGYLNKQGGSIKTWKKRWFIMKETYLFYFSDKEDPNPKGIICLKEASVDRCAQDLGRKHSFCIKTPDRQYFIGASNEAEEEEWIAAIMKKAGQSWSSSVRMSGNFSALSIGGKDRSSSRSLSAVSTNSE